MNCNGCGKEGAKLQCPTCVKLGGEELLSKSFFCSQQCFKDSWATHKAIHPQKKSGMIYYFVSLFNLILVDKIPRFNQPNKKYSNYHRRRTKPFPRFQLYWNFKSLALWSKENCSFTYQKTRLC